MSSSCENCKYYIQGVCGGVGRTCEDYFAIPIIPEKEKKYWTNIINDSKPKRRKIVFTREWTALEYGSRY